MIWVTKEGKTRQFFLQANRSIHLCEQKPNPSHKTVPFYTHFCGCKIDNANIDMIAPLMSSKSYLMFCRSTIEVI